MSSFLFKEEYEKEKDSDTNALRLRSLRRNVKVLPQVGKSDIERDEVRKALMPGKRISKNGNTYWETRTNRSDSKGSSI